MRSQSDLTALTLSCYECQNQTTDRARSGVSFTTVQKKQKLIVTGELNSNLEQIPSLRIPPGSRRDEANEFSCALEEAVKCSRQNVSVSQAVK